jgi:fructose/tagatose bisphosphate aldolase
MPLEDVRVMAERARRGGYAIGYFEAWNLESLQGVLDAAEESLSPIFIGFNGDFLSDPDRIAFERMSIYAALGRAAAATALVRCALVFNECPREDWIEWAIMAGFNLVVPTLPGIELQESTRRVVKLANMAHEHGSAIEGEVGVLPCGSAGMEMTHGRRTEPEIAARFVESTNVDLLAVSVGNVHIRIKGEGDLDLELLKVIHERVAVPLVLHGGTGITRKSLQAAIGLGVAKVNFGTYLKQRYRAAIMHSLSNERPNPHELFGLGGEHDVMVAGRAAVREAVLERLQWLGCCGRA